MQDVQQKTHSLNRNAKLCAAARVVGPRHAGSLRDGAVLGALLAHLPVQLRVHLARPDLQAPAKHTCALRLKLRVHQLEVQTLSASLRV